MKPMEEFIMLDRLKSHLAWLRLDKLELEHLQPLRDEIASRIEEHISGSKKISRHD